MSHGDYLRDPIEIYRASRAQALIDTLDLRRPIFQQTAAYGHFGREDQGFRWEETDHADALRSKAGL